MRGVVCSEIDSVDSGGTLLLDRLSIVHSCGPVAGKLFCLLIAFDVLLHYLLCRLFVESDIDIAPDFDLTKYTEDEMNPAQHSSLHDTANDRQESAKAGCESVNSNGCESVEFDGGDFDHFVTRKPDDDDDFDDDDDLDDLKL